MGRAGGTTTALDGVSGCFGIIGENFLFVMDERKAKHGGTRAQCRVRFCSWRLKVTSATADGTVDV